MSVHPRLRSALRRARGLAVLAGLGVAFGGLTSGAAEPADDAAAHVVALAGDAYAVRTDGRIRPLACFDRVDAGEIVFTADGSRVGILAGEVYAQLDPRANLVVDRTTDGTPDLRLLDGTLRLVDTRSDGARSFRLETPEGRARSLGSDTAVAVTRGEMRERTRFCESAEPVEIERFRPSDALGHAPPGSCAVVTSAGKLLEEPGRDEIPLAGTDSCGVATLADLADLFHPGDVAAPPIAAYEFPDLGPVDPLSRQPCDDPGSGCAGASSFQFLDPEPDLGCGRPGFGCGD